MRSPWEESTGIVPWLLAIVVVLGLGLVIRYAVGLDTLVAKRDLIDVTAKLVASLAIVIGGILSYVRFFKGRILKPKLTITVTTGCVSLSLHNLHWVDVVLDNKGSVAVWNYRVQLWAVLHGPEGKTVPVERFMRVPGNRADGEHLVDVAETGSEHALLSVPKSTEAITFIVQVTDQHGTRWDRC